MNRLSFTRLVAVLVLALIAGAGCRSAAGDGFTPGASLLTPDATATDVPTATAAAATAIAPTSPAQPTDSGVYPIYDGQTGYVMGAVKDGEWIDAVTAAGLVSGDIKYRLFVGGEQTGETVGSISTPPESSGPCVYPQVTAINGRGPDDSIGVAGDWDVTPHPVESLSTGIPDYVSIIEAVLTENGLPGTVANLTSVLKADMEGDGKDEIVIGASWLARGEDTNTIMPGVDVGDYSLVALRKIVGDEAKTIPFDVTVYTETNDLAYPWRATVMALLDLNGDGDLEIVVEQLAYEGREIEVYEVNGEEVRLVISGGCSI